MGKKVNRIFGYVILLGLIGIVVSKLISPTDELDSTSWKLTEMAGAAPVEGSIISARFSDGKVSGSSGCNTYGGSYEVKENTLQISSTSVTEMACGTAGVMDQEQDYLEYLSKSESYELGETQLEIFTSEGIELVFVSVQ